jgi:hypothetical protein
MSHIAAAGGEGSAHRVKESVEVKGIEKRSQPAYKTRQFGSAQGMSETLP